VSPSSKGKKVPKGYKIFVAPMDDDDFREHVGKNGVKYELKDPFDEIMEEWLRSDDARRFYAGSDSDSDDAAAMPLSSLNAATSQPDPQVICRANYSLTMTRDILQAKGNDYKER
jgi:hypothetical protein